MNASPFCTFACAVLICGLASAAAEEPARPATAADPAAAAAPAQPVSLAETLLVTDLVAGIGDEVLPGTIAVVHYSGWLFDPAVPDGHGKPFDSSRDRNQPFSFPLGAGHVIRGWEQGVAGMRVGGLRRLVIPPSLGYGSRNMGNGLIPPNSTLLFEVELLGVETVTFTPQAQ